MRIRGFYGVVDVPPPGAAELAAALVEGGADVVQVRLKGAPAAVLYETARAVRQVTAPAGVLLVVNDRLDVALAAKADAVHLGQRDLPLGAARAALTACGRTLLIGVSTHSPAQAEAAAFDGADYLGFGPVFATATKEDPDPVQGLQALAETVARVRVPVVAIGGITPERAAEVAGAGAAAVCAISAVNRAPGGVVSAARTIADAFVPSAAGPSGTPPARPRP